MILQTTFHVPYSEGPIQMFLRFIVRSSVALTLLLGTTAWAQSSQVYKVIVPESVGIAAPGAVQLTHDQSNNPQVFQDQTWSVRGNSTKGVNVVFKVDTPFVHSTNNAWKVDAKLDLSVGTTQGSASWQVTKATDQTNIAGNDLDAAVTATSNGVGRANMILKVSFLSPEWGTYAAGEYVTTVVGTVALNP